MNRAERRKQQKLTGQKAKHGNSAPSREHAQALQLAVSHHSAGRLPQAEQIYRQILQANPNQPDALHLLGVIAAKSGDAQKAVDLITKSLSVKPDFVDALINLGTALYSLEQFEEAANHFKKAVGYKPGTAEVHYKLGNALRKSGRLDEAVLSFEKSISLKPDYITAAINLIELYTQMDKLQEAVSSCNKILSFKPDYVEVLMDRGRALMAQGEHDEAVADFHHVLEIDPDFADAHINIGYSYREQGKLDEAAASFQKTVSLKPEYARAHFHLANIKKNTEKNNNIKAMEKNFAVPDLDPADKAYLAFGLGKAFEDIGQYQQAFDYLQAGNDLTRSTFEFSISQVERTFQTIKETFTIDLLGNNSATESFDVTPIFVLGMPRSGTTLVEQILASHPRVYGAGELMYLDQVVFSQYGALDDNRFHQNITQADTDTFAATGSKYRDLIRSLSNGEPFITDKMPGNFLHIGMIKLLLPEARIVHCCRDPRDNCLSLFKNLFNEDAYHYAYKQTELGQYYSLYNDLMTHWKSVLPDTIYDIHYENVVADKETQSRALLEFCGLEWDDACLDFHKTNRQIRTASASQVRKPIYKDSVQSWKRYEDQLGPLFEALP